MRSGEKCVLTEKDLELERGLKALEIHDRLVALARLDRRVEAALCFYLLESMSGSSISTMGMPPPSTTRAKPKRFQSSTTRTFALSMTWANKTERASSSWSSSKERRSNIG